MNNINATSTEYIHIESIIPDDFTAWSNVAHAVDSWITAVYMVSHNCNINDLRTAIDRNLDKTIAVDQSADSRFKWLQAIRDLEKIAHQRWNKNIQMGPKGYSWIQGLPLQPIEINNDPSTWKRYFADAVHDEKSELAIMEFLEEQLRNGIAQGLHALHTLSTITQYAPMITPNDAEVAFRRRLWRNPVFNTFLVQTCPNDFWKLILKPRDATDITNIVIHALTYQEHHQSPERIKHIIDMHELYCSMDVPDPWIKALQHQQPEIIHEQCAVLDL